MKKKFVVLYYDYVGNVPVAVCEVREEEPIEFLNLKKECEKNAISLNVRRDEKLAKLYEKIENLEKEIKILKGEE